jgi:F-type H+-transporting ATPase subunit b
MPQLDIATFAPQLIWLAITFVLLYALMAWVALPKVGRMIDERRSRIETDLRDAQTMRAQAETIRIAYERTLAEARSAAQAELRETLDRMTAEAAERQREAGIRLGAETAAAEARIAEARQAALSNVRTIAIEVASSVAQRLVGGEPDAGTVAHAVDAALSERA